ncbi:hypothetical protein ACP70R_037068 [Stipagrostis hirtigluma subsp. patula]
MADTYQTDVVVDDGSVIRTTVTSRSRAVSQFLQPFQGRQGLIVGLDAEWRPNFEPGGRANRIAVLQLCVGRRCLVYQIIHDDMFAPALQSFLANPGVSFVGVGVGKDAQKLLDEYGLQVANAVDLRPVAAAALWRPELNQAGLRAVVLAVMGVNIDKPQRVTLSAWDARDLTLEQVRYATIDAYVSYEVGRRLLSVE